MDLVALLRAAGFKAEVVNGHVEVRDGWTTWRADVANKTWRPMVRISVGSAGARPDERTRAHLCEAVGWDADG